MLIGICWPESRSFCCFFRMSCELSGPLTRRFSSSSGMLFKIASYMLAIKIGLCYVPVCPKPWYRPTGEGGFEEPEGISCEGEESRLECSL